MGFWNKIIKDTAKNAGLLIGDMRSANARNATSAAADDMELFRQKTQSPIIRNGQFDTQKGNLFEYIEAAKFNVDAAAKGSAAKAIVTDAQGKSQATADILIRKNGRTEKMIQAKFSQTYKDGRDNSAAASVYEQTGAKNMGWGQYDGMDRLIRKQDDYNQTGSLLDEAKTIAKTRAESNGLYAKYYKDVYDHLTDETTYGDITSGGTTIEEVKAAYYSPERYAKRFEQEVVKNEMKISARNMAQASLVITGIVSGVSNLFEVLNNDKALSEALQDIGVNTVKSGIRGSAVGATGTLLRYRGIKKGDPILSDSAAATVLAGGMIDGGVALYSYAMGELTPNELKEQLTDTTVRAVSTVYFTKAVEAAVGTADPFLPIAIYTVASYVVACTKSILKEAMLNEQEYERLTAVHNESAKMLEEFNTQLQKDIYSYSVEKRGIMYGFLNEFDYEMSTGENYDRALRSILKFADQTGMVLQHRSFSEFEEAMNSSDDFVLK